MRKETFLELLSDIDDELIDEAEKPKKKKRGSVIKYLATAACICMVLGGSLIGSFIEHSEEKTVKNSPMSSTQKIADAEETYATDKNECLADGGNQDKVAEKSSAIESQDSEKIENKAYNKSRAGNENNLYNGEGTGEFIFNKKTYCIVNSTDYLLANNLPTQINTVDVGSNLANNVQDTANNNIGNVYEYKHISNQEMLIVEDTNGTYNLAVEK